MKNNISNNNWEALGDKVAEYTPDEFSTPEWDAMENMLHPPVAPAGSILTTLKSNAPLIISTLALSIAIFVIVTRFSDKATSVENLTATNAIEIEAEKQSNSTIKSTTTSATTNTNQNKSVRVDAPIVSEQQAKTETTSNNTTSIRQKTDTSVNKIAKNTDSKSTNTSRINLGKTNYTIPTENNTYINQISTQQNESLKSDTKTIEGDKSNLIFAPSGFNNTNTKNIVSNSIDQNTLMGEVIPSLGLSVLDLPEFKFLAPSPNKVVKSPLDKRVKFGVQFGLNNSITDYSAFTTSHLPFGGIYIKKRLSEKWEVQLGAQLKFVDKYDLNRSDTIEWFDHNGELAGSESVSHTINGYISLDLPLSVNYKINNKLQIVSGLRYTYIPNVSRIHNSRYNKIRRVSFRSGLQGDTIYSPLDDFIIKGFWNHEMGLVLGLNYSISRRILLDLRWNQGILDISPDDLYEGDDSIHLNSDLQLSLNYTF